MDTDLKSLVSLHETFFGKSVLVTGHTGFKGSWLSLWLRQLGARVSGIALEPPSNPSHFEAVMLGDLIDDYRLDIRDLDSLEGLISDIQPDFVFHLAAQALVGRAYKDPVETYECNVLGSVNLLESLRGLSEQCVTIIVTSDKVYENLEWTWGYRETDSLGGYDPYSGSKGAAELLIRAHLRSYFPIEGNIRVGIGRAGNVIGGGDWAENRIVPDLIRSIMAKTQINLRSPQSTRPWQHVLEPLSGYIWLASKLAVDRKFHEEAFNFGPTESGPEHTVGELVNRILCYWELEKNVNLGHSEQAFPESNLLQLNCDKARNLLQWRSVLDFEETVKLTAEWYKNWSNSGKAVNCTIEQIVKYCNLAMFRGLPWAN